MWPAPPCGRLLAGQIGLLAAPALLGVFQRRVRRCKLRLQRCPPLAFQFLCVANTIIENAMNIMLMTRMSIVKIFPTSDMARAP